MKRSKLAGLMVSLLVGCLPALETECTSHAECLRGRCIQQSCVTLDGGSLDTALPDAGECVPSVEICNAQDDDCDGQIDEEIAELCFNAEFGLVGHGVCRAGVQFCVDGELGECVGQVIPTEELCNGLDDNCNDSADEGLHLAISCYSGPPETAGIGACREGHLPCIEGEPGLCAGEITPREEACDLIDNDCDGSTDEGIDCACDFEGVRECYTGPPGSLGVAGCRPGQQTCIEDIGGTRRLGPCEGEITPVAETCDEMDNDCDTIIDEFDEPACEIGIGECRVAGSLVCNEAGSRCTGVVGAPGTEICDGLDNDCDGSTDEGARSTDDCPEVPTLGGQCARGTQACVEGQGQGECIDRIEPGLEICNLEDDDCDGQVDEDLMCNCQEGDMVPCGEVARDGVGTCRAGIVVCVGGQFGACEGSVSPTEEVCDGIDNDCDGQTDNTFETDIPCLSGVGMCQSAGRTYCAGDRILCDAEEGIPEEETCDGQDNDCDDEVDEDIASSGECEIGQCVQAAQFQCQDGGWVCIAAPEQPVMSSPEICNDIDDDCDGLTDEGFELNEPCLVNDCAGTTQCSGDATTCIPLNEPGEEVCDGLDNDCNGEIDDIGNFGSECHSACGADGTFQCVGAQQVCVVDSDVDIVDRCDGVDDDCDGQIGEGSCLHGQCNVEQCECTAHWFDLDGAPGCERGCGLQANQLMQDGHNIATHAVLEGAATAVFNSNTREILLTTPSGNTLAMAEGIEPGIISQILVGHFGQNPRTWVVAARFRAQANHSSPRFIVSYLQDGAGAPDKVEERLLGERVSFAGMTTTNDNHLYLAYLATGVASPPNGSDDRNQPRRRLYVLHVAPGAQLPNTLAVTPALLIDEEEDWSNRLDQGVGITQDLPAPPERVGDLTLVVPLIQGEWFAGLLDHDTLDIFRFGVADAHHQRGAVSLVRGQDTSHLLGYTGDGGAWARIIETGFDEGFGPDLLLSPSATNVSVVSTHRGYLSFVTDQQADAGQRCFLGLLDAQGNTQTYEPFTRMRCNFVTAHNQLDQGPTAVATIDPLNRVFVETEACE